MPKVHACHCQATCSEKVWRQKRRTRYTVQMISETPDKMNKRPKRLSNPRPQIKQAWDINHESIILHRVRCKWRLLCSYFLSCERVQLQSTFIIVTRASARLLRLSVRGTGNKEIFRYQPSVNRYSLSVEKVSFINVFQHVWRLI